MFLSEWREFLSGPCVAGKNLMTARVSMLLKSRPSLTCFRAYFLSGRAKDLSAPWVLNVFATVFMAVVLYADASRITVRITKSTRQKHHTIT